MRTRRIPRRNSPVGEGKDVASPPSNSHRNTDVLIAFLAFVVFLPSINGDFVFDDAESVVNNPVVNGQVELKEILHRDYWGNVIASPHSHKSYRPLTTLTFWLNHKLHGNWTTGYHFVNLLLHVAISLLFARVVRSETVDDFYSRAPAILFAVHPIHSEAVCNITGRAELLMTLFFLLGYLCYTNSSSKFLVLPLLCVLSFFSKEQGVMLPIFLCFLEAMQKRTLTRRSILTTIFFVTVFGLQCALRLHINNYESPKFSVADNSQAFIEQPLWRYANFVYLWAYNIYLLLNPSNLCFDYSMGCISNITSLSDPRMLVVLLIFMAPVIGWIFYNQLDKESRRLLSFGVLLGMVSFLPASNLFVTVGFTIAERVLYLPSTAAAIGIAVGIKYFITTDANRKTVLSAICVIYIALCQKRATEWRTEYSLYESGLRVCPSNAKIHYNLAKILTDKGRTNEAVLEYDTAIRLNPHYDHALNNLANIYEQKGRYEEAERLLQKALRLRPNFATAWMNLGITKMQLENYKESLFCFHRSLNLRPYSSDCHYNLGNLYRKTNNLTAALDEWRTSTELDPSNTAAWINRFVLLDELEMCSDVVDLARQAIAHTNHPAIHFQVGSCYGQIGQLQKAEFYLARAVQLKPENPLYHANLGVLYQRWKRYEEAEREYSIALSLDYTNEGVAENLEIVRSKCRNQTIV